MSDIFDLDETDDFAYRIWKAIETKHDDAAREKIKSRDAAQRQAGREEMKAYIAELECEVGEYHEIRAKDRERYAALEEALKPFAEMSDAIGEARPSIQQETDNVYGFEKVVLTLGDFHRARKALSDLDEARKG